MNVLLWVAIVIAVLALCGVGLHYIRVMSADIAEMLMTHQPYTRRPPVWFKRVWQRWRT